LTVPDSAPFKRLQSWLDEALQSESRVHDAMQLATADARGRPQVRTVLLREHDSEGLYFYTNYESRKGDAIRANAYASVCLHWKSLKRQILAEGLIERASPERSDAYFAGRPRGSQIGAWASRQSAPMPGPNALQDAIHELEARFEGKPVPRPPFWGGYRLIPDRFEFWQDRADRLHDRDLYVRTPDGWTISTLYP